MNSAVNTIEAEFHQVKKHFESKLLAILKWCLKILDNQIDEHIRQKKDFEAKYQRATDTIAQLRREIGDLQSKYNARFEFSTSNRAKIV